jgi:Zn finger protein HypA/HybF involved in hydrogenase expression
MNSKSRRYGYQLCDKHQQEFLQYCSGCALNLPAMMYCLSCKWTGSDQQLRQVYRPPDTSAYWVCPDCGSVDIEIINTT